MQNSLRTAGFPYDIVELSTPTRTAAEAAQAVGCDIGQIAKSLVFERVPGGLPLLVIASGSHRVDEGRLSNVVGAHKIRKPEAEYVRRVTGFAIGGVPPIGHDTLLETLIDETLLRYPYIWAAAGTPNALFRMDPKDLVPMTGGRVVSVR